MSRSGSWRAWAWLLALAPGCRHRAPDPALEALPLPAAPSPSPPAGRVEDGVYRDDRLLLSVPVPAGWTATVGRDADPLRLTLTEPRGAEALVVEIAAVPGGPVAPLPRPGCAWSFQDRGRFALPGRVGDLTIATCTPDDAALPRVLSWVFENGYTAWHVDVSVPRGAMSRVPEALDAVLAGARMGD